MITKEQLLDACRHETAVIKHLAGKFPADSWDWRPTPPQRSSLELMRYLTVAASIPAVKCVTGNWDHAQAMSQEAEAVTPESFAAAMDAQMARIEEEFAKIDEAAASTTPAEMPWQAPAPQSEVMMRTVYASLVAYRMAFFLWARQQGADITTADCWVGVSRPPA